MSNEANGGGMSRVEALEAVAEAAERVVRLGFVQSDGALAQSVAALRALDALPAAPAPARGEVVEVWKSASGRYEFFEPNTRHRIPGWSCKGTTRLAMVKGDGA